MPRFYFVPIASALCFLSNSIFSSTFLTVRLRFVNYVREKIPVKKHYHNPKENMTMANEGKVDLAQTITGTVQSLSGLAVAQITALDKGIQTLTPTIENMNKNLAGVLETGAKTVTETLNSLSEPLNTLVATMGDVAVKGIETVGGWGWKAAETVGFVGNNMLSVVQSAVGTVGSAVSSVLPIGKKL